MKINFHFKQCFYQLYGQTDMHWITLTLLDIWTLDIPTDIWTEQQTSYGKIDYLYYWYKPSFPMFYPLGCCNDTWNAINTSVKWTVATFWLSWGTVRRWKQFSVGRCEISISEFVLQLTFSKKSEKNSFFWTQISQHWVGLF